MKPNSIHLLAHRYQSLSCLLSDVPGETAFAVEQYRKRFSTIGMFENRVYDGVPEMLQRLKAAGKHLAVATSSQTLYTANSDAFSID